MAHVHPRQRCVCPPRYLASSTIDTNSSSFCHRKTQMKARLKKSTSASVNADASGKKLTEPSTTFERHLQEFNTHTGMSLPSLHRRTPCLRRKNITSATSVTATDTHRTTWRWKRILQSNDRDEQCYYSPHGLRLAEIKPQAPKPHGECRTRVARTVNE